jgi:hypothetical protein
MEELHAEDLIGLMFSNNLGCIKVVGIDPSNPRTHVMAASLILNNPFPISINVLKTYHPINRSLDTAVERLVRE